MTTLIRALKRLMMVTVILLGATLASAQNMPACIPDASLVSNPNWIVFTASPDHAAASGYRIGIFADGVTPSNATTGATNAITSVMVPKSELTVSASDSTCVGMRLDTVTTLPLLATPISLLTPYRGSVRTIVTVATATTLAGEADWAGVSNPFNRVPFPRPASGVAATK